LLPGEDAAAHQELLARIRVAVKPNDIIDDVFIADVAALEWEVLRWRRLKTRLIRERALSELKSLLSGKLDYSRRFAEALTEIFQEKFPNHPDDLAQLAHRCAQDEQDALDEARKLLDTLDFDLDGIRGDVETEEDEDFMQEYVRQEPDAITLVGEILAEAGSSMEALVVNAVVYRLDAVERIDRLTTVAEGRRNAALREIDRRRAVVGEALRRTVQEVEDAEFKVIETTPAKGKKAA
jgi:hypothetical protein